MAVNSVKELAVCHLIKNGGNLLLIKAEEGLNKGKWNAPSGEILKGETPAKSAMRNVFQQTGVYVSKVNYHGTVRLFLNGKNEYSHRLHIFSTKLFSGDLKPNIKGEARWFNFSDIPYYEMWADDRYWTNLVLQGKEFEADFFFDEKNEKITKYQIREKQKILQKIIVPVIIIAVIAVVAFGAFSLYGSLSKTGNTTTVKQVVLAPTNTPTGSTSVTTTIQQASTSATTTIAPAPAIVTVDNINLKYNYSGPSQYGGQYCNTPTKSDTIYYKRIFTGRVQFYLNTTIVTSGCNLTISGIRTITPGFIIKSITPSTPQTVPPFSTEYFEIVVVTPNTTFTGPLSLVIDDR